jgi:phosphoglycolate phosphatase
MHLIFDLDGTLVDSSAGIYYALEQAIWEVCPGSRFERASFRIGPPVGEMLRQGLRTATDEEVMRLEQAFRKVYDGEGWQKSCVYPGVMETLAQFRQQHFQLYIATNKPALPAGKISSYLDLAPFFREMVCPDSRTPGFKNKATCIQYLCEKYVAGGEQVFYVGDALQDCQAAQTAGIGFVGVEYGYGEFENRPPGTQWASTFTELWTIFDGYFRQSQLVT